MIFCGKNARLQPATNVPMGNAQFAARNGQINGTNRRKIWSKSILIMNL
jgi:hypothetical protein